MLTAMIVWMFYCLGAVMVPDASKLFAGVFYANGNFRLDVAKPKGKNHTANRQASLLCTSDSLVLEHPDHDSPILFLALSRLIVAYLPAFAHSPGRKHIGQRNVALLL